MSMTVSGRDNVGKFKQRVWQLHSMENLTPQMLFIIIIDH
jgi:hypothetical protein